MWGRKCIVGAAIAVIGGAPAFGCPTLDPAVVAEMVRKIAEEEGIEPDLALATAEVESAMGRDQISPAGAEGVMQLMPGTAADLGVTDRCDADANIRGGVRYLKRLFDEFGDPVLMLAAYNAGPGRVREKGGIPENAETAAYIVKILNRWKYGALRRDETGKATAAEPPPAPETATWKENHVIEVQ